MRLTGFAPEALTLMGAMNLAALNIANAIGAWAGSVTIAAGYGPLSAVWASFGPTLLALLVFAPILPKAPQFAPA
ncbi:MULTISPECIES: hypothetical protein [unclassified Bosea (in: a-proteobacteria)]|uniref:hypothetical protein n=1 Tax=unclassified Bosea (in: a-proteobacteria) TaxID=2653178 RepID=UPI003F918DF2